MTVAGTACLLARPWTCRSPMIGFTYMVLACEYHVLSIRTLELVGMLMVTCMVHMTRMCSLLIRLRFSRPVGVSLLASIDFMLHRSG